MIVVFLYELVAVEAKVLSAPLTLYIVDSLRCLNIKKLAFGTHTIIISNIADNHFERLGKLTSINSQIVIIELIGNLGFKNAPAFRAALEMIIALYELATAPAEELAALRTSYLVATLDLADGGLAAGALLRASLQILNVQRLLDHHHRFLRLTLLQVV